MLFSDEQKDNSSHNVKRIKDYHMIHIFNTHKFLLIIVVFKLKQHYFNTQNVMI